MKITLDIKDSKFNTFLAFIKTLDYVSIAGEETNIPQWQKDEVNERMKLIEKGKMQTRDWDKTKKDIFKK